MGVILTWVLYLASWGVIYVCAEKFPHNDEPLGVGALPLDTMLLCWSGGVHSNSQQERYSIKRRQDSLVPRPVPDFISSSGENSHHLIAIDTGRPVNTKAADSDAKYISPPLLLLF